MASFVAVLASLMLFSTRRYKFPLGMAWFAPGYDWGGFVAGDIGRDESSVLVLW